MHERGSEARKPVMAAFLLHAWIADDGSSRFAKLMGGGEITRSRKGVPAESHIWDDGSIGSKLQLRSMERRKWTEICGLPGIEGLRSR